MSRTPRQPYSRKPALTPSQIDRSRRKILARSASQKKASPYTRAYAVAGAPFPESLEGPAKRRVREAVAKLYPVQARDLLHAHGCLAQHKSWVCMRVLGHDGPHVYYHWVNRKTGRLFPIAWWPQARVTDTEDVWMKKADQAVYGPSGRPQQSDEEEPRMSDHSSLINPNAQREYEQRELTKKLQIEAAYQTQAPQQYRGGGAMHTGYPIPAVPPSRATEAAPMSLAGTMDRIQSEVAELYAVIDAIEQRLSVVMAPDPSVEKNGGMGVGLSGPTSPLIVHGEQIAEGVRLASARLRTIRHRLLL